MHIYLLQMDWILQTRLVRVQIEKIKKDEIRYTQDQKEKEWVVVVTVVIIVVLVEQWNDSTIIYILSTEDVIA